MKCILMNKDVEVLTVSFDEKLNEFDKVYEVNNIKYAPLILSKINDASKIEFTLSLSNWFKKRSVLTKSQDSENYYLSLSDQYWLKPYEKDVKYENINYFDNDFEKIYHNNMSLLTGYDSNKFWIIKNGKRYFVKEVFKDEVLEPFHEYLSSQISKRLGFCYVPYNLGLYKNNIISICPCFIDKDKEYVEAYQILEGIECKNSYDTYKKYIKLLEEQKIENAREKVENMFIIDFLMMNEDRNLNNFGVVREEGTLKWIDTAPLFDTSHSLVVQDFSQNSVVTSGYAMFFSELISFDNLIDIVENIERIDVNKLDGIVDEYYTVLTKYQKYTKVPIERINLECFLLKRQIDKLKKLIQTKEDKKVR